MFRPCILRILCCSGPCCMHNVYSATHTRETHAGWQSAYRRKVNNRDNALYTHNTGPKTQNHTSGGRLEAQGLWSLRPLDPGPPNGHIRGIQCAWFPTQSVLCIYCPRWNLPYDLKTMHLLSFHDKKTTIYMPCHLLVLKIDMRSLDGTLYLGTRNSCMLIYNCGSCKGTSYAL